MTRALRCVPAVPLTVVLLASAVAAQPAAPPVRLGWLSLTDSPDRRVREGLQEGLRELGWVEGRDFVLDRRSAGDPVAAGLVDRLARPEENITGAARALQVRIVPFSITTPERLAAGLDAIGRARVDGLLDDGDPATYAARARGLTLPQSLVLRADEVIR